MVSENLGYTLAVYGGFTLNERGTGYSLRCAASRQDWTAIGNIQERKTNISYKREGEEGTEGSVHVCVCVCVRVCACACVCASMCAYVRGMCACGCIVKKQTPR